MSQAKKTQSAESSFDFSAIFPYIAIPVALIVSAILYVNVLGDAANFEGGDPEKGHPLNVLGTIHKGGFIVPILITVNLVVVIFFVERMISLTQAKGKGSVSKFVRNVRSLVASGQVDQAMAACDKQKGSVAAVVKAGLMKYKSVEADASMDRESKVTAVKTELDEASSLELPMLSKNLVILSTCASLGISSFEAMATAGAPDATALSLGISEALINTFLGILGSALAIVLFNFFSTRIDSLTHAIDEAGFSVSQAVAAKK
jgi:biopolymer transport protein ExbB